MKPEVYEFYAKWLRGRLGADSLLGLICSDEDNRILYVPDRRTSDCTVRAFKLGNFVFYTDFIPYAYVLGALLPPSGFRGYAMFLSIMTSVMATDYQAQKIERLVYAPSHENLLLLTADCHHSDWLGTLGFYQHACTALNVSGMGEQELRKWVNAARKLK